MFSFAPLHIFTSRGKESLYKSVLQVDFTTDDLHLAVKKAYRHLKTGALKFWQCCCRRFVSFAIWRRPDCYIFIVVSEKFTFSSFKDSVRHFSRVIQKTGTSN